MYVSVIQKCPHVSFLEYTSCHKLRQKQSQSCSCLLMQKISSVLVKESLCSIYFASGANIWNYFLFCPVKSYFLWVFPTPCTSKRAYLYINWVPFLYVTCQTPDSRWRHIPMNRISFYLGKRSVTQTDLQLYEPLQKYAVHSLNRTLFMIYPLFISTLVNTYIYMYIFRPLHENQLALDGFFLILWVIPTWGNCAWHAVNVIIWPLVNYGNASLISLLHIMLLTYNIPLKQCVISRK